MNISLRKIQAQDNPILAALIRSCFHDFGVSNPEGTVYTDPTTDDLSTLFETDKSVLWVALQEEEICGCCGIFPTENLPADCTELVKFYIAKQGRGKGIGRLLLEKSLQSASEIGYRQVYLETIAEYANAVSIYEKQGFQYLDAAMGNSGHHRCTIWMLKNI